MIEHPALYEIAREICHENGMDWYDPRTGKKHPAPKKRKVKRPTPKRTEPSAADTEKNA